MLSDQIKKGVNRAPNRSLLFALGLTEEEMSRPLVGIVSSHNEIVPGHMNLDKIAEAVKAGIRAEAIDPAEAIRLEPSVNRTLTGAVRVPDGAVDPFRLTVSNVFDAQLHGADVLTYHEVTAIDKEGDRVVGVTVVNTQTKQTESYRSRLVINAGGIWGHHIAEMAGDYIPYDTVLTSARMVGGETGKGGTSLQMGCGEGKTGVLRGSCCGNRGLRG